MATVPRPMALARRPRLRPLAAAGAVAGVAVLVDLLQRPWYLNYDARYALLWAGDILHGRRPDYDAPFAPTPHPLSTAWSALAAPFGDGGDRLMVWLVLLSFGAVVWLAFALGERLFNRPVGVVAALIVLTRPALLRSTGLGYQDLPFAALVLWAVLLEVRRPRRGTPVLAVLAVAGLLRPEAWVLAGLYWLYLLPAVDRGTAIRLAGLVALAPVLWAGMDLAVTGDPLHSLHGTAQLAAEADRRRSVVKAPYWTAKYLGFTLRAPLIVAAPLGLAFAYRRRQPRAAVPLIVAAVMLLVFAVNPVFGLPLISRYVYTPAVLLAVFGAAAVAGWTMLRPGTPQRRLWQAAAVVAVVAFAAWGPENVSLVRAEVHRLHRDSRMYADLRSLARSPAVHAAAHACGPLTAADHRPVPYLRYWLHGAPGSVAMLDAHRGAGHVVVLPRHVGRLYGFYGPRFPKARRPPGWRLVEASASWRVFTAPGCPG